MTRGSGFVTDYCGLHLQAEAKDDGWYYRITRPAGGNILADWTLGPAPATNEYQEPEDVRYEALTTAMGLLGSKDNPHEVFRSLPWRPYGPQE